jgi:hypothetical protein
VQEAVIAEFTPVLDEAAAKAGAQARLRPAAATTVAAAMPRLAAPLPASIPALSEELLT